LNGKLSALPVLLRVHNRLDDLQENIGIIRTRWRRGEYPLYVAFNGAEAGYRLPEGILRSAKVITFDANPGHISGALQMLFEGLAAIPEEYDFAVTLEADTWLLDDRIVAKYLELMSRDDRVVWAAGNWVDKYHSLAVDFALVRLSFVRECAGRFAFKDHIESRLYNLIESAGLKSMIIDEVNPTHLPKAAPLVVQASGRRRRAFPRAPMATHHIEDLPGGMEEKKLIANRTAGETIFPTGDTEAWLKFIRFGYLAYDRSLALIPKSRWAKGRKLNLQISNFKSS